MLCILSDPMAEDRGSNPPKPDSADGADDDALDESSADSSPPSADAPESDAAEKADGEPDAAEAKSAEAAADASDATSDDDGERDDGDDDLDDAETVPLRPGERAADSDDDEPAAQAADGDDDGPPPSLPPPSRAPKPVGAAWALPLVRLDDVWTRTEAKLCAWVLLTEIGALTFWIALKGLSAEYQEESKDISGLAFRALFGAVAFGFVAYRVTKRMWGPISEKSRKHQTVITASIIVGALAAKLWANAGADYFSNLLNWMQGASMLTLIGGLRGLVTRLTLWLALLGGSLATGQGKHINIDVVMRFVSPRVRVPVAALGWMAACVMCVAGVWGFFDHIAIQDFIKNEVEYTRPCDHDPDAICEITPSEKWSKVTHEIRTDIFLLNRQASLDLRTLPKVVMGEEYGTYLHANDWNGWLADGGWEAHYAAEDIQGLKMDPTAQDETRLPRIAIPGGDEAVAGLLVRELNLVFPFGLLMIALRFLLRTLLVLSGHVDVDPDSAHADDSKEDEAPSDGAEPEGAAS